MGWKFIRGLCSREKVDTNPLGDFFERQERQTLLVERAKFDCLTIQNNSVNTGGFAYIGEAADVYYPILESSGAWRALNIVAEHFKVEIETVIEEYLIIVVPSPRIDFDGSVWARPKERPIGYGPPKLRIV